MESPQSGIMKNIEFKMNQNSDQNATNIISICDLDKYTNNTVCTQANNCNNIDENTTLNHEKQMHQILETVLSINLYAGAYRGGFYWGAKVSSLANSKN